MLNPSTILHGRADISRGTVIHYPCANMKEVTMNDPKQKTFQITFEVLVDRRYSMTLCRDVTAPNGHQAVIVGRKELRKFGALDDSGTLIEGRRVGKLRVTDVMRIDNRPEYHDPDRAPDPRGDELPTLLSMAEYRRQQKIAREVSAAGPRCAYQIPLVGEIS